MKKIIYWFVTFTVMMMIIMLVYYFSSQNRQTSNKLNEKIYNLIVPNFLVKDRTKVYIFIRKVGHMIEFSIVYLVIFLFLKNFWIRPYYKTLIISIIIAILDEIHQYFIQGRVCSIWDVLIDIVGMLIMIRIIRFFYFMKDKKQRGKLC